MANLRPKTTGVEGAVIWVSSGESHGTSSQHGPRIKVSIGDSLSPETLREARSLTIEENPRLVGKPLPGAILRGARAFVIINQEILLAYWRGEVDTAEFLSKVKPC